MNGSDYQDARDHRRRARDQADNLVVFMIVGLWVVFVFALFMRLKVEMDGRAQIIQLELCADMAHPELELRCQPYTGTQSAP